MQGETPPYVNKNMQQSYLNEYKISSKNVDISNLYNHIPKIITLN